MKTHSTQHLSAAGLLLFCTLCLPLPGQVGPGQYEDEAPIRTWNQWGPLSASAAGLGGTRYARGGDYMAVLVNPALSCRHPDITFSLNGGVTNTEFRKFAFVNTGVIHSDETSNLAASIYALDFAGITINHKGWGLAVNISLLEDYTRPEVVVETEDRGSVYHRLDFFQEGQLRNLHFSLSRWITSRMAVGMGLNFISGNFERRWEEEYLISRVTITDLKQHEFSGTFFNGGVLFLPAENLSLAAVFRTPCTLKADSLSELSNLTAGAGSEIRIDVAEESRFQRPLILGAGLDWQILGPLNFSADVTYFGWSDYTADYFGESLFRDFKDVVRLSAGIEFRTLSSLFGRAFVFPMWLGFCRDPQPMREPDSAYSYLTFGTGIRGRSFHADLSTMLGFERGSGDDLKARKTILTIGFAF